MLSAPRGTGKSYYINNYLEPFLKDKCNKKCIIVSLYGLREIKEISKSIFMEAKFNLTNKNNAGLNTGKIVAKTVVKGVASFFGINLDIKEEDLDKLYSSIDLSDKLIVFEDVERSRIDIIEILGYVNNLVEQDGVKVLLVTNENELLHYIKSETKDNFKKESYELDEISKNYLKVKEKTISDTITFYASNRDAILNIMGKYDNKYLNMIKNEKFASLIENDIMAYKGINSQNLRSFIFACQKTVDMFETLPFEVNIDFFKNVFLGNVAFALRRKNNDILKWTYNDENSTELGTYTYPLYRFSYDYICNQYIDIELIKKSYKDFCLYQEYLNDKNELTSFLDIIYSYYIRTEKEVIDALKKLDNILKNTNRIPIEEYCKLANYLVSIKYDLNCNELVDDCKELMLSKLAEVDDKALRKIRLGNGIQLETQEAVDELNEFKNKIKDMISHNDNELNFDYLKSSIYSFCDFVHKNKDSFIDKRGFAKKLIMKNLLIYYLHVTLKKYQN